MSKAAKRLSVHGPMPNPERRHVTLALSVERRAFRLSS